MATERVERRLVAILAADVAGYSRLLGTDEEGPLARLKAIRREVRQLQIMRTRAGAEICHTQNLGMLGTRDVEHHHLPGAPGTAKRSKSKTAFAVPCSVSTRYKKLSAIPAVKARRRGS